MSVRIIDQLMCNQSGMLQLHQQFHEQVTITEVKPVMFISEVLFGRQVCLLLNCQYSPIAAWLSLTPNVSNNIGVRCLI